jgi:uncharacterized membrane protein YfcA
VPDGGEMALGALIVFAAAFLGGLTGFGYGLAAAPLLLLTGFPLRFVVTANLALGGLTRLSVVYRFRRHISRRRSLGMCAASVPGLYVGARVLSDVPESAVKLLAGCAVMVTVVLLARSLDRPPPKPIPGAPLAAGFVGGFLGGSTSLAGIGPIVLLSRDKAAPTSFLADLAVFFVWTSTVGLSLLALERALAPEAFYPAVLLWLPGGLAGNLLGTVVGPRLAERQFRRLILAVLFAAGAVTAASGWET